MQRSQARQVIRTFWDAAASGATNSFSIFNGPQRRGSSGCLASSAPARTSSSAVRKRMVRSATETSFISCSKRSRSAALSGPDPSSRLRFFVATPAARSSPMVVALARAKPGNFATGAKYSSSWCVWASGFKRLPEMKKEPRGRAASDRPLVHRLPPTQPPQHSRLPTVAVSPSGNWLLYI